MLLNNQKNQWRNKKGNRNIPRNKWQWKHSNSKPTGCTKNIAKREVYSNTSLLKETRKTANQKANLMPKATREKRIPKLVEGKKNIKIRAEINEKEKETIAKISKTKSWFLEKINDTDTSLARLIMEQKTKNGWGERPKPITLEMKKWKLSQTTEIKKIKIIIREYCQKPHTNKMPTKFLQRNEQIIGKV